MTQKCACGSELHYPNAETKMFIDTLIQAFGDNVEVEVEGRKWEVPRHYIALHGLKAAELPTLGFKEVTDANSQAE